MALTSTVIRDGKRFVPINVFINGNKLFEWSGNPDAVARIDQEVVRIANLSNFPPEQVASSAMRHVIAKHGFFTSTPEVEMLLMLWTLLQMPTNCLDRPGRLRDYIELWDFDLDVSPTPDPKRFHVEITGGFNVSGTA